MGEGEQREPCRCLVLCLQTFLSPIYSPNEIMKAEDEPRGSHKGGELALKNFSLESGGNGQPLSPGHWSWQGWREMFVLTWHQGSPKCIVLINALCHKCECCVEFTPRPEMRGQL